MVRFDILRMIIDAMEKYDYEYKTIHITNNHVILSMRHNGNYISKMIPIDNIECSKEPRLIVELTIDGMINKLEGDSTND